MNSNGVEEFFSTGDMLGTILNDVFADINIYDDDIRLLQRRFVSPIGSGAISFYKFYLMDTVMVDKTNVYTSRLFHRTLRTSDSPDTCMCWMIQPTL